MQRAEFKCLGFTFFSIRQLSFFAVKEETFFPGVTEFVNFTLNNYFRHE